MRVDTPRLLKILNVLHRRVESGENPLEEQMPTESELCDEFGTSRFTVREALRRVQRRQGSGSVVVAATSQARYVHSLSSLADLSQFAFNTYYDLLSIRQVTLVEKVAQEIGGEAGSRWWLIEGLRTSERGGSVLCYVRSYVLRRLSRYIRELHRCTGPFHVHFAKRTSEKIIEVVQELRGEAMSRAIAGRLRQKTGTIGVCALRRYTTRHGTLIASYNWHVAQDFHFRMKMSLDV